MLNIRKIIAIQNHGTSGTTLMHSLLDNHPNIISLPYLHGSFLYQAWEQITDQKTADKDLVFEKIKILLPILFDITHALEPSLTQMGENSDERLEVEEKKFFLYLDSYFSQVSNITRKQFIISIYLAYNFCYNNNFKEDDFICFPIHSQPKQYAQYLVDDFSYVYFLHMTRDPMQSIGSIIKHIDHLHRKTFQAKPSFFKNLVHCAISQIVLEKSCHWYKDSMPVYGKKPYFSDVILDKKVILSRFVRLEDVHKNPKFILEKICKWIAIEWNDNLLKSTFMGLKWHNRAESVRVSGVSKIISQQKHNQYLSEFDLLRLSLITMNEKKYFNYPYSDNKFFHAILPILAILPFRVELSYQRFLFRIQAVFKEIYHKTSFTSMLNLILRNDASHTKAPVFGESYDKNKIPLSKKVCYFGFYAPFLMAKTIFNYFWLRAIILMIWFKNSWGKCDNSSYVKMLYNPNDLPKDE